MVASPPHTSEKSNRTLHLRAALLDSLAGGAGPQNLERRIASFVFAGAVLALAREAA